MNQNEDQDWHPTADVGAQRVAKVYAEALLKAGEKDHQEEAVFEELEALVCEVFRADPQIEAFFHSRAIGRDRKGQLLQSVFADRSSKIFANFLMVLNEHERLDLLRPILEALRQLRDQRARRIHVQVQTAVPLPDDQRDRLRQGLKESFHLEPVMELQVDPDLLGGMVVRVGDWLYDASVRSQIETIRNQLIERSSYEIQTRRDRFSSS